MSGVIGWAVVDNSNIKIKTVSDTRRAAMVNWLVTEKHLFIFAETTGEEIERMWALFRESADVEFVTILRTHDTGTLNIQKGEP